MIWFAHFSDGIKLNIEISLSWVRGEPKEEHV